MDAATPAWWQTRWFLIALVAAAALPLLWPTIPPLTDLPGHIGRYRVQFDAGQHPWLAERYSFRWALIGNLGVDLAIVPLAPLLGIEGAVKAVVIAIPVLTVTGILWTARELHGRVPAATLFALPVAYSYPLHFGFVNFALAMALALNLFALWLRLARQGRIALRAATLVPAGCILWVVHAYGWALLGVLAFSAELVRQRDRRGGWAAALPPAAVGCLPLLPPVLLMLAWRTTGTAAGGTGDWFNWRAKALWFTTMFRDRWQVLDLATLGVLLLVLLRGRRDGRAAWHPAMTLAALLLLAAFLLMPRIMFGSAYADMRLAPFVLAVALIALRPAAPATERRLALAGLCLFAVRIAATTASFLLYSRTYDRELAALDHVPVGARLVTFVGEPCAEDWASPRLEHLSGIALERRLAFSNDQWALAGAQLLTVHYPAAGAFAQDPSQNVVVAGCRPGRSRAVGDALATVPRDAFDYVWLIAPPPHDPRAAAGLTPLWRSGASVLYRIDR